MESRHNGDDETDLQVSVALIVRNEERTLGRCLESIRDAVDEIVIVDTGSTDRTKEIAAGYTDRIFDFEWRKDFAAARQYALDQARGEWVFWLDADDVVRNADAIRPLLSRTPLSVGLIYWWYEVARDKHGNLTCEYLRERCARRGLGRWTGRIHETLSAPGELHFAAEVVVEHHPEPNRPTLARNIEIMEAIRQDEGETPRLLFYLGRDYGTAGQLEQALEAFGRYLMGATWDDERYQAQTQVAELLRRQGRYGEAIDVDLQALKIHPTWPDAYFGLAKSYYFLEDWPKVVHWSEIGETYAPPQTMAIINPMDYRFSWIIYYTNALYHVGRIEDALLWTREALSIDPDDPWHRENERVFNGMVASGSR